MFFGTNPQTANRWAQADSLKPGALGYANAQAGLRSWIDEQVQGAISSGQLDPNDRVGLQSFLATLGVTPEKGGGRFIFNEIMNRGGAAKYAGTQRPEMGSMPGGQVQGAMQPQAMARQALESRYGAPSPVGFSQPERPVAGQYSAGAFGPMSMPNRNDDWRF